MRRTWRQAAAWLAAVGLAGGWLLPFLRLAPNRLLTGAGIGLAQVSLAGGIALTAAWLLAAFVGARAPRTAPWLAALAWPGVLLLAAAGARAITVAGHQRVQLAAGFWVMLACALLAWLDALRHAPPRLRALHGLVAIVGVPAMAMGGVFGALAITQEYRIQRAAFLPAIAQHLALAASATVLALLAGLPLAWLAWRRARFRDAVLAVLNLLQTVPSIALFALLIGPLAWAAAHVGGLRYLGIGGTGAAPAVIALALYALLPVVRYALAGMAGVPAGAIDAARGMGMDARQVFLHVQGPLALPVLIGGLRIVAVQSVGLATVAALIGAGGLGRFVFLGLGQGANDLVMLATLAIIALALATDGLFLALRRWTEPRL
jgi:osmoprotectant transport system permease protein